MGDQGAESYNKKQLRRSAPKSRAGCITCKKRRVKCDETKPFCLRCVSGDWNCDGYQSRQAVRPRKLVARLPNDFSVVSTAAISASRITEALRVSISSQRNSLLDFPGTPKEHRSLDYFFSRAASDLGIFLDDSFWNIPASRIASLEKSVRHALIAVARYHEDHLRELEMEGAIDDQMVQPFALTQYNKAIQAVSSQLYRDRFGHRTAVLACFLFVCLEFFKGSPDTALTQLHGGMMMQATYTRLYGHNKDHADKLKESPFDEMDNRIAVIFSRFRISALNTTPILHKFYIPMGEFSSTEKESLAQPFSTVAGAKEHLDTLIIRSFKPCDSSHGAIFGVVTEEEKSRRKSMIEQLDDWAKQLGLLTIDTIPPPTTDEIQTIRFLRIQSLMATIWNSVTVSGHQTAFDSHLKHFQSIFQLTEQVVVNQIKQFETNSSRPLEPQSIKTNDSLYMLISDPTTPLAFLSCRCRHPLLRRQATQLLIHMASYPIWWNALIYAKIADRIIHFEESQCLYPVTEDMSTWPTEQQRIHGCFFLPAHDPRAGNQTTMFLWQPKENGELEHWFERTGLKERLSWRVCFPDEE